MVLQPSQQLPHSRQLGEAAALAMHAEPAVLVALAASAAIASVDEAGAGNARPYSSTGNACARVPVPIAYAAASCCSVAAVSC
jgi:hypothetical protein